MERVIFLAALVFTTLSCSTEKNFSEAESARVQREAHQVLVDYYVAIGERGLMAEFDYLDSTGSFFWVPPGASEPLSYDSIYQVLKQNAPLYKSIVNTWDTISIRPLSAEYALYTGRLQSSMTDTTNLTSVLKLVETGVLVKRKSGWKLLSGQTSVISNP
jgi:hypothetical protein